MADQQRGLAVREQPSGGVLATWGFGDEERELIKRQIAPGATDGELNVFLAFASRCKLDPFQRPPLLWAYKRSDKPNEKLTIDVSIDGLRLIASRFDAYEGQTAPQYCGEDGQWRDVWASLDGPPVACRIGVYRRGYREPQWGIAYYDQSKNNSPVWDKQPLQMLANAAERRAIKKAFQHDIQQVLGHDIRVDINDDERMQERTRQFVEDEKRNSALYAPARTPAHPFRVVDADGVIDEGPLGNVDMAEVVEEEAEGAEPAGTLFDEPSEPEDPRAAIIAEQVAKWVRTWQRKVLKEADKPRFWLALQKAIQEGTAEAEVLEMVKAQVLPQ